MLKNFEYLSCLPFLILICMGADSSPQKRGKESHIHMFANAGQFHCLHVFHLKQLVYSANIPGKACSINHLFWVVLRTKIQMTPWDKLQAMELNHINTFFFPPLFFKVRNLLQLIIYIYIYVCVCVWVHVCIFSHPR